MSSAHYPSIPSLEAFSYWLGIDMSAAEANNASLLDKFTFLFIISLKLTNCIQKKDVSGNLR